MNRWIRTLCPCSAALLGHAAVAVLGSLALAPPASSAPRAPGDQTAACTPDERHQALKTLQAQVTQAAPQRLDSLEQAVRPGGPLAGWRLSHGHVVLASAGAVAVDKVRTKDPMPQLLLYAPSPASAPREWLDWGGEDGPYRLVGWAYIAPFRGESDPPSRRCIDASEWWIHEAGWHLTDGGMHLTPGAAAAPPHPDLKTGIFFWHPRAWSIHFWIGSDGTPDVSFANPGRNGRGLELPEGAFFRVANGRKELPAVR
jgi:hypothetical protein